MPDTSIEPDTLRSDILRSAAALLAQNSPGLPPDAGLLLARLYAGVPTLDLAQTSPEAMAAAAADLWSLAAQRLPGTARVRVTRLVLGGGARVQINTDDMPFLVDSATALLSDLGSVVRELRHPVLAVRRDATGRLLGLDGPPDGPRESLMHIELTGLPPETERLEARLRQVLDDVRVANADHAAMQALLAAAREEIRPGDDGPADAFLAWLADENFVLLGHRCLSLAPDGALAVAEAENYGLLRDPAVVPFDVLRDLATLSPAAREQLLAPVPLTVAKANLRTCVHLSRHGDVVATRVFAPGGAVTGVRLFYGLFAAAAYTRNPRAIPLLAEKVVRIQAQAGFDPASHDGRALRAVLDTWPRDELFQAPDEDILTGALRALDLRLRPRTAVVLRHDPFERFVSAIIWLPRDVFDTRLRARVGNMLASAFDGRVSAFYIALGDEPLARMHYIIRTVPGAVPPVDPAALEAAIRQAARDFRSRLVEALTQGDGEAEAARLATRWGEAFPASYRETTSAAQAVADLRMAEACLSSGRPKLNLARLPGAEEGILTLRLAQPGAPLPLSDTLPLLESLDLKAIEEVPYYLDPAGARVVLQVITVRAGAAADEAVFPKLLEALGALLRGAAEADGFNRLVLLAGLDWRECWQLRTLHRWLKQVGFPFGQASVERALAAYPEAARLLVALMHARFAPDRPDRDESAIAAGWDALIDTVTNSDDDRILTRLMTVMRAMVRTNFFQDKPYLAIKFVSADAGDMPLPRPWREIFVNSPRTEGCHLRAGPVARGGIRWSDRREDFRTEILGLMKAQRLKNVVIVPTGAKGGFVLRQAPPASDREAFQAEGVACYRMLINAMLDLADDIREGVIVTPNGIVRRDTEDPYMVAAADKGTATFSDIANSIAVERGFWLGDAFASGGSQGYDHKAMGITARGAWVMIARHFSEIGLDIQTDPFSCAGVGDMSGDVFGNGLLVSRKTRLVAAFDHRHIFLDPDPDADASYDERARMFALPRSSWADYDRSRISPGGGVFARAEKRIPLSPQAQALLGIAQPQAEPTDIMQAILRLPVDLLYFGGIGTYVKASTESQADAGDRTNDALRVNGSEIRARVLGEGANLGITQAGRIEFSRSGGRINTDALDNSAGVSTSDHEVNIKILTTDAEQSGVLTRRQRDDLLASMTDEVGTLVLSDNHAQSLAVSLEMREAAANLSAHAALMARLEEAGLLDRAVIGLPDAAVIQVRQASGEGLVRPEVAALLPVAKLWLSDAVEGGALPADPAFGPALLTYFPARLQAEYSRYALRHRLSRELIATEIANRVANRLGPAALARLAAEAAPARIAQAAWLASAVFDLERHCASVDAALAPALVRLDALLALRRLHEAATRDLLVGARELDMPLDQAIASLHPHMAALAAAAAEEAGSGAEALRLIEAGLPAPLAGLIAAVPALLEAPAIVRLAAAAAVDPAAAAAAWHCTGRALGLPALRAAINGLSLRGSFASGAKAALMADLMAAQGRLARAALAEDLLAGTAANAAGALVREVVMAPDLAGLGLAVRAVAAIK